MLMMGVTASVENTLSLIFNVARSADVVLPQILPVNAIPNVAKKADFITIFLAKSPEWSKIAQATYF